MNMKRFKGMALAAIAAAAAVLPASGQVTIGNPTAFCTQYALANGTASNINQTVYLPQDVAWKGDVQLCCVLEAATATSTATKGNFTTNMVLKFDFLVGTNVTTDTPFTWTIGTNQIGNLAVAPWTNTVTLWTNLTSKAGLTALRLSTAEGSGTNAYGPKLTVLMGRPQ